ncbi:hypothetical protein JCM10207_005028 [Rhodosporidiobolus poonsookiae]
MLNPITSPTSRRRRSTKSSSDLARDALPHGKKEDDRTRIGVACVSCRKRKIRCDGQQPACANCVKAGRHECSYVAVSAEENKAAKERKLEAKLRREARNADNARRASAESLAESAPDDSAAFATQLSARRRWNRTIRLDSRGGLSKKASSSAASSASGHGKAPRPLSMATPSGLSEAALGWHISSPGCHTAPVSSATRKSYFDHDPGTLQPLTPLDEVRPPTTAFLAPANGFFGAPSSATLSSTSPSPSSGAIPLPPEPQYPPTPPTDAIPLADAILSVPTTNPWTDFSSGTASRSTPHAYAQSQLRQPQYDSTPNAAWQLYHALPDVPVSAPSVELALVSPPYSVGTCTSLPGAIPVSPPPLTLSIPRDPLPLQTYAPQPDLLTPTSTYESPSSLGLYFDHQAAPTLYIDPRMTSVHQQMAPELAPEVAETPDVWTQAWVDEQNRRSHLPEERIAYPVW